MPPKGKRGRGEPPKGKMDRSEPPRGDHTLGGKPPSPPTMGLYLRTAYDSLSPTPPAAEQTAATPVSTPSPPAAWTMESPLSALLKSAATSSPEVKVLSDEEYSEMFLQFLRSHMEAGESFPLYKANAAALIERSCFILEVDYAHLLKPGVPKALALRIGNDKDRQPIWLRNAVRTFFEEVYEYVNTKRVEKLIPDNNKIKTARVVFRDKPKQVFSLQDLSAHKKQLVRKMILKKSRLICRVASLLGMGVLVLSISSSFCIRHTWSVV
ncbi:uncharacterized protein LOC125509419 isoform X1 [Triticum urartu]|uniref:uncharacterized protein LOC125509419 isoform X1 n=1 Tax=Triticum urartu TaxID=4572 RepID=UPI0020441E5B|nr:uncharacterized protein LOC125509419 isoform X1 [Triticum urartu]